MEKVAILSCVLGGFDTPKDPVEQDIPATFHRWTDENFPLIAGLTPRLQYRIPKYFGWQMLPGYDFYIWLDGGISLLRRDCATWYLSQIDGYDIGFFEHPHRNSIEAEVRHVDDYLHRRVGTKRGQDYIISRYENGLHKEQLRIIQKDKHYSDDKLYATTVFAYRNNPRVQAFMKDWWYYQSRYFTCDQIPLPWLCDNWGLKVKTFDEPLYKTGYMSLVSHHR